MAPVNGLPSDPPGRAGIGWALPLVAASLLASAGCFAPSCPASGAFYGLRAVMTTGDAGHAVVNLTVGDLTAYPALGKLMADWRDHAYAADYYPATETSEQTASQVVLSLQGRAAGYQWPDSTFVTVHLETEDFDHTFRLSTTRQECGET